MKHLLLEFKATTTTDQGEFTALAAAYTIDRDNERIVPGAFAKSIANWQASGKMIPLHWNHSGAAEDIIGIVDPGSMRETDQGLEVKGQLDLNENDVAREAWRLMKKNAVSLSFGFLPLRTAKASDGVVELKQIDLFEITITPSPANPDTRFLALKAIKAPSEATAIRIINSMVGQCREYIEAEPDSADREVMEEVIEALEALLEEDEADEADGGATSNGKATDTNELTQKPAVPAAIEDGEDEEPEGAKSRSQDPLRKRGEEVEFALKTAGLDLSQPPTQEEPREKHTPPTAAELRKRDYDLTLSLLTGGISA